MCTWQCSLPQSCFHMQTGLFYFVTQFLIHNHTLAGKHLRLFSLVFPCKYQVQALIIRLPLHHHLHLSLINERSLPLLSPQPLREQMSHATTGIGANARTLAQIVTSMVPAVFVERTILQRTMTFV